MVVKNHKLKLKLWESGLTMNDLSERTRVPRPYISMMVNGRYNPDQSEMVAIANALGCEVHEVFPTARA